MKDSLDQINFFRDHATNEDERDSIARDGIEVEGEIKAIEWVLGIDAPLPSPAMNNNDELPF